MPLISLSTNLALEPAQELQLASQLSALVAKSLGKPEQWVMAHISSGQSMSFAASFDPCAYIECKSIGLKDGQIPPLAREVSQLLQQELQLDPSRVYIEFASAEPQRWGWNGGTF